MSITTIHQHRLPNGLWLIAEPIAASKSLAMTLLTPAGSAPEPVDQQGVAAVLSDLIFRGAGGRSARDHCDALDNLGVQRDASVETHHLRLSAAMIGRHVDQALPLLADVICRPNLDEATFAPSRDLAIAAIDSLNDEPQQRVMLTLRQRFNPQPLGRSLYGQREHLQALTIEQARDYWKRRVCPDGAILAFAGAFDWAQLRSLVEQHFSNWQGKAVETPAGAPGPRGYLHESAQTAQVHLALAYDALSEADPRNMTQRAAVAVLSGGMSGRLFTNVREERGLCYAVYALYSGQRDRGGVVAYAGTTGPRAQETLDVLTAELRRMSEGVASDEFERAIVGMKSRLVMQGESTAARAAALAHDQFLLDRPRSLDELAELVDAVTLDDLNDFVRSHPPGEMTIVTIGPEPLQVPKS